MKRIFFRQSLVILMLIVTASIAVSALSSADETYEEGKEHYLQENYGEAFTLFLSAATQGHAISQYILGYMYGSGEGIEEDDNEAFKWYRMAAEQGLPEAQNSLGAMYAIGKGILKNDAEAVKWYRKAAEQGYAEAQWNLGVMLVDSEEDLKNDAEAVKWIRMAADQGVELAQKELLALSDDSGNITETDTSVVSSESYMTTLFTIVVLFVYAAIATFLGLYLLNIAGLPGALLAGAPSSTRSLLRFKVGTVVCALGQSYVYLSFVAFMVSWTTGAAGRDDTIGLLIWPISFVSAIGPVFKNLIRGRVESQEFDYGNPQVEALHMTVLASIIGFFLFAFLPSTMKSAWGWVPYVSN